MSSSGLKSKTTKSHSKMLRHRPMGTKPGGKSFKGGAKGRRNHDGDDSENDDAEDLETDKIVQGKMKGVQWEDDDEGHMQRSMDNDDEEDDYEDIEDEDVNEDLFYDHKNQPSILGKNNNKSRPYGKKEDVEEEEDLGIYEEETALQFLSANKQQSMSLADIILMKLREKEEGLTSTSAAHPDDGDAADEDGDDNAAGTGASGVAAGNMNSNIIPPKVIEVYTSVGQLLQHYRSGKIPKALKMLPHLKHWERILWLTRPDLWSPAATYAVTRIFASNLHVKLAQRYYNLVLLEKCRDDIQSHNILNYHLYISLKKCLFKPAAFFKGILLPLATSGNCTLREALIMGSVLLKVSVPAIHSAAALLRLTEVPYNAAISVFIKILLQKKYALPMRVLTSLVKHFTSFLEEKRTLPIIWHVSWLMFIQRYKLELTESQTEEMLLLVRMKGHHEIGQEIRRELMVRNTMNATANK